MTTTADLRALAVSALVGKTAAGNRVYSPMDQATWDGGYPVLFLTTPLETGESYGRGGAPAFTVTATLRIEGRAEELALPNDAGAAKLLVDLEALRDGIKACVINFTPLMNELQQFSFFKSTVVPAPKEAADHIGAAIVEIGLEFVQGPHEFYQPLVVPLTGIDLTVKEPDGTQQPGLTIDLPQ